MKQTLEKTEGVLNLNGQSRETFIQNETES